MTESLISFPEKLATRLTEIPEEAGVYLMKDQEDRLLYIGKSKRLRSRVRSYFRPSQHLTPRLAKMVRQVVDIEFIVTDTEAEALVLEANLIKQYQPYFNVLLKDDKRYPYICITWSEKYPRIFITRKRRLKNQKDRYYGPFVDVKLLKDTLEIIKKAFPLRQRPKPLFKERTCLNYDLGKCPGVCQGLISSENYHQIVEKVAMIFQGRSQELRANLQKQMETAAAELKFEQAAKLRDQLKALSDLNREQKVAFTNDTISQDIIALAHNQEHCCLQLFQIRSGRLVGRLGFFVENASSFGEILQRVLEEHYLQGEGDEIPSEIIVQYELIDPDILTNWLTQKKGKKVTIIVPQRQQKADLIEMVARNAAYELERIQKTSDRQIQSLQDLAHILQLDQLPKRIEGYDISHLQGSNAVASQVVFIDGIPAKQYYRHYQIKNPTVTIGHSDDFASLAEVIERRFHHKNSDNFPDLIMIDGGKGQLSAVVSVLEKLNLLNKIKVISLAKKREEIFIPKTSQPLVTDPEQPGVQLLRRIRDEAHRFAVTFHRQQRLKQSRKSQLDAISGLGFQRQKLLLDHFHSLDYIREASVQQLAEVPGIGLNLAKKIYHYFHS